MVIGSPSSIAEYSAHCKNKAPNMGMAQAFLRRPRSNDDYLYWSEHVTEIEYTAHRYTFLKWCHHHLEEPSGFSFLYEKRVWVGGGGFGHRVHLTAHPNFMAYMKESLIDVLLTGTPAFKKQAYQHLLIDGEDLGTTKQLNAILAMPRDQFDAGLVERLVLFNPRLLDNLQEYDNDPMIMNLFLKLGGSVDEMEISDVLSMTGSDDSDNFPWLRVLLEQRKSLVEKCINDFREDHENDEDTADTPFGGMFKGPLRELLEEFSLL
jgi:hypothetical protein